MPVAPDLVGAAETGWFVGLRVGLILGEAVVGVAEGDGVTGAAVEGDEVTGAAEGDGVIGALEGDGVTGAAGDTLGLRLGDFDGIALGDAEGPAVGDVLGLRLGDFDGDALGDAEVGDAVHTRHDSHAPSTTAQVSVAFFIPEQSSKVSNASMLKAVAA